MYRLENINVFPLKSAAGISIPQATIGKRGIQWDRHWMIVDDQGKFLSQRQLPKMALIQTALTTEGMILRAPEMTDLFVGFQQYEQSKTITIWQDTFAAGWVSKTADQWFSQFLQCDCHLVVMKEDIQRIVDQTYAHEQDETGFADGFPLLLISTASLEDLNSKLEEPIDMIRFRPNIVISGCEPYEEDSWKQISIASMVFSVVKPCSRCVIPTIDPRNGMKDTAMQPLRTLSGYRKGADNKVYFGQNIIHREQGDIQVGNEISLIK